MGICFTAAFFFSAQLNNLLSSTQLGTDTTFSKRRLSGCGCSGVQLLTFLPCGFCSSGGEAFFCLCFVGWLFFLHARTRRFLSVSAYIIMLVDVCLCIFVCVYLGVFVCMCACVCRLSIHSLISAFSCDFRSMTSHNLA